MFLGWPSWKFLPEILIPQETWLWWRGLLALYGNEEKNSSSLKSLINFKIVSQKYSLRDPFQKLFTKLLSVYSHGSGCEDLFALQGDKKNFLFLLYWNGWSDFEIISEMFLGWPFSKIVREIFIRPLKTGRIMGSPMAGGRRPLLCPEHISKTILATVMKFHGWIDLIKRECSVQES